MSTKAKDLTKEAPASPKSRVGGYIILARLADKARAEFMGGNIGEYHTDCPLDHMLLDWKGVHYSDVKKLIVETRRVSGPERYAQDGAGSEGVDRQHDRDESLPLAGKAGLVRRRVQTSRSRSGHDSDVRLA